jgi:hypothetical protein
MHRGYRLIVRGGESIGDADTLDEALEVAGGAAPGRYRLMKYAFDPVTGELLSWEWGMITRDWWGGVQLEIPGKHNRRPRARAEGQGGR